MFPSRVEDEAFIQEPFCQTLSSGSVSSQYRDDVSEDDRDAECPSLENTENERLDKESKWIRIANKNDKNDTSNIRGRVGFKVGELKCYRG